MEVANVILIINHTPQILEAFNKKKQYQDIWWIGETSTVKAEGMIQSLESKRSHHLL